MSSVVTHVTAGKDAAAGTVTPLRTGPSAMRSEEPREEPPPLKYDEKAGRAAGFDVPATRAGAFLSQMRLLRRKVLDATAARRNAGESPLVLITSAVPGDGKSFTAFHLARSLTAERDLEVVLMDCDIARQRISGLFPAGEGSGLSTCLDAGAPLSSVLRPADLQRLSVVRAGENTPGVIDVLASSRWDRVVTEMRAGGGSRIFIADSPPVLGLAETQYLARTADLVLFVVRAEVTPQQAVREALSRLTDVPRMAFVFNAYAAAGADSYYNYYSDTGNATRTDQKA